MVLAEERLPMDVWNAKKEVQFSQRSVDAAYKSRWHFMAEQEIHSGRVLVHEIKRSSPIFWIMW